MTNFSTVRIEDLSQLQKITFEKITRVRKETAFSEEALKVLQNYYIGRDGKQPETIDKFCNMLERWREFKTIDLYNKWRYFKNPVATWAQIPEFFLPLPNGGVVLSVLIKK